MTRLPYLLLTLIVFPCLSVWAESQGDDYKGITDPFGDPANYEFAEDEKEDKEFFHLGRFFMLGFDVGAAIFTGGLGLSTDPGAYVGGRLLYFLDRQIAFEAGAHYSNHLDIPRNSTGSADIDTTLISLKLGFRYYFDTKNAPKAIAIANPYLALGGGAYLRNQTVLGVSGSFRNADPNGNTTNFGAFGGAGLEFPFYKRHLYLGIDVRYHLVFFIDEDDRFANETGQPALDEGARAGDYFTPCVSLTYNF